jgi:hypothetical protein
MPISNDFTIDYVNKRIYHSSGTDIYTVNALYSYLMDTFDELAQMDDTVPMSAQTPTEYTLINGWFIDDESLQHLKGGAIQTVGHNNEIRIISMQSAGYTPCVSGDIGKEVVAGTTLDSGTLLAFNNTTLKWWVRMDDSADLFDQAEALTITGGTGAGTTSGASITGENLWANVYTLGSIEEDDSQQIYIEQNGARIFSGLEWWPETASGTQHIDVLIKVKESGVEINEALVTVFLRHYPTTGEADLYDHFGIDLTAGGRNAVPLATSPDLNNTSAHALVSGYNDITVAFVNGQVTCSGISGQFSNYEAVSSSSGGVAVFLAQSANSGAGSITLGNVVGDFLSSDTITGLTSGETATATANLSHAYKAGKAFEQSATQNYSVLIDCAGRPLSQLYEYLKYIARIGSTFSMYPTTMPQSGVGTHQEVPGQLYIRAHEDAQLAPTNIFSPVKASPFGTFAGGTFFGAQGIWIENMDTADVQSFQLINSEGATQTPPNQQAISIGNLVAGDRVAVFRTTTGSTIDKAMYTSAAGNNLGNTDFVTTQPISADTPASGTIRIVDISDTGSTRETRYAYSSWSGSTFSGLSPALDRNYITGSDTAYVPYIDQETIDSSASVTVIYASDRSILVRVRRKTAIAILPFETTGVFNATGYSTTCIRTEDTIVT